MRAATIGTTVFLMCLVAWASPLAAACRWTEVMMPYLVCTDWWDGTRTCHWQEGTFDVYECDPAGTPPPPPPDGGALPQVPPPDCEIVAVSDEYPDQPILSVQANDAVVEMTLLYDGYANQSAAPSTDQFALQPVNFFALGFTSVGVQCRNSAYVYANSVMQVGRSASSRRKEANVYGVWTKFKMDDEPEQFTGDWSRAVILEMIETAYSVATVGSRNGAYEHISVNDYLDPVGETPRPDWDELYAVPTLFGEVYRDGWDCGGVYESHRCAGIREFALDISPNGRSIISRMEIPFQSSIGVTIMQGKEISIGPW